MSDRDEELRKAVALFRYGLIADVLRLAPGSPDIRRTLHEKAQPIFNIFRGDSRKCSVICTAFLT